MQNPPERNKPLHPLRALVAAAWLTLRGKTVQPPPPPYPRLQRWIATTVQLAEAVLHAADAAGLPAAARQQLTLRIEGRALKFETALQTVLHHARQEYPYLLRNLTEHSLTAIYASNLNDRYYIAQFRDSALLTDAAVQAALGALGAHLDAIPPSTTLEADAADD